LKAFVSTNVTMGFGCFDASNGAPGGGVCANVATAQASATIAAGRKLTGRIIRNIIIDGVQATVRSLFINRESGARSVSLEAVQATAGGFDGDRHAGHSRQRQILLISGPTLDELSLEPGAISENVVVDGLDVMSLKEGEQLRLGGALVSVTIPCDPCVQMDRLRRGLRAALHNRRGMFVKVLAPGTVRVGDAIEVLGRQ
jgi:MOSC domain-containing protein YiiM